MTDVLKFGKRIFTVGVVVTTILWSLGVAALVPAVANAASCPTLNAGDMIKVSGKAAIYTVNNANKVLYFPSGDEFKSWNVDNTYGGYTTITQECYDSLAVPSTFPVGVNFRPGSYVVKRPSSDQIYVVEPNNTLAKINTTDAAALYGASYVVRTVGDIFWPNYVNRGSDVAGKVHDGMLVSNAGKTWYVDGNVLREVTATGMTANRFKAAWVHAVPASYISGLATGTTIDALVSSVSNRAQDGSVVTPVGGAVTVSLAADTPAAQTIPMKATGVTYLKFNVKATSGAVTLNDMVLHRIGVGAYDDLAAVYIYDGNTRLSSGRTISSDTNQATFANLKVSLAAGETKTLSVLADLKTAGGNNGNVDGFEVVSANGAAVSGVSGNLMSVGGASASSVTVDNSGSSGSFRLGASQVEVARGSINAGSATYDVKLTRLTLTNAGSLSNSYLANLKLTVGSTDVATAATMTGDKVVFTLTSPYTVTKGDTKTFTVYADNTGGRVDDTIKLYVDETSDVGILDSQYNLGALVTNSFASGDQTYTITGGDLTLSNNGPAAGNIGKNISNVILQKFSFSATNAVTVKSTKIWLYTQTAAGAAVTTTAYGNYYKNLKIVDLDNSNSTVVGPESAMGTNGTVGDTGLIAFYKTFTDSFSVAAGKTRHFAVMADVDTNTVANSKVYTKVDFSVASTVKYDDNSQYVSSANIVPNTLTGNIMTVSGASLAVAKVTPPASASVVKGATQNALGILLTPGTSDAVKITSLKLRVYASTTALTSDAGDTPANAVVNTVALYEDGASTPLATKNLSDSSGTITAGTVSANYYYVTYTGLNYVVPAGVSKKLVAVLGLKDSISATRYVMVEMVPSDDIDVETAVDGKSVTESSTTAINATSPVQLTVNVSGGFSIAVDGTTPTADVILSGTVAPVTMTTYKIKGTQENFTLVGAAVTTTASRARDIKDVTLTYKNKAGDTVTKTCYLNAAGCTFTDGQLDMYLPKDQYALVTIGAHFNTTGDGAVSGDDIKIGFTKAANQFGTADTLTDEFIVLGESSNTKLKGLTDTATIGNLTDSTVAAQTIHKTNVTVAQGDTGTAGHGTSATDAIGVFKFVSASEPGSNQNSTLGTVTLKLTGGLIANAVGNNTVAVSLYSGSTFDAAHLMGSGTFLNVDTATTDNLNVLLTAKNEFSGEKLVYVVVDTTDSDFVDAASTDSKLTTQLVSYRWTDGTTEGTSIAPVTGVPLNGLTYSY